MNEWDHFEPRRKLTTWASIIYMVSFFRQIEDWGVEVRLRSIQSLYWALGAGLTGL